jgi:hypothetical protein
MGVRLERRRDHDSLSFGSADEGGTAIAARARSNRCRERAPGAIRGLFLWRGAALPSRFDRRTLRAAMRAALRDRR